MSRNQTLLIATSGPSSVATTRWRSRAAAARAMPLTTSAATAGSGRTIVVTATRAG